MTANNYLLRVPQIIVLCKCNAKPVFRVLIMTDITWSQLVLSEYVTLSKDTYIMAVPHVFQMTASHISHDTQQRSTLLWHK